MQPSVLDNLEQTEEPSSKTPTEEDSAETSAESSPTNSRRISKIHRHHGATMPLSSEPTTRAGASGVFQDEFTPLLGQITPRRSRVRIAEGAETPKARLSRHQSATSMSTVSPGTTQASEVVQLIKCIAANMSHQATHIDHGITVEQDHGASDW
jgi:hypothetical protein